MSAQKFVRQGSVLDGAQPWSNLSINPTFRGQVLIEDGTIVQAFIKDLNPRQLANELFVAALGLTAALPVPMPILAIVDPGIIPVSAFPLPGSDQHLVFASADAASPTVVQVVNSVGGAPVLNHIAQWFDLGRLYGFDSWVANVDRHANNLLLSGAGLVWMIDHGHCFTGPAWIAEDLIASKEYPNRLQEWMTPALNDEQKAKAAGVAPTVANGLGESEILSLGEGNFVDGFLEDDFAAAVRFLAARIPHIQRLASSALEVLV